MDNLNKLVERKLDELRNYLSPIKSEIEKVILFGSTIKGGDKEFNDIDILIKHRGSFKQFKALLTETFDNPNNIVENAHLGYSNHPAWKDNGVLPFHILCYTENEKLTSKVKKGIEESIDITDLIL